MQELQVALALAVSMLIFSTLVPLIVEIIYRVFRVRRLGLGSMLKQFYRDELANGMQTLLSPGVNPANTPAGFKQSMLTFSGGGTTLSTFDFIRRLAETDIGKRLAQRTEWEVDLLIDHLAARYEDYGNRASQLFRRYSQFFTVIIAVAFAVALNINAVTLVRTFQDNEKLTDAVAAQAGQAMANYQAQVEQLRKVAEADQAAAVEQELGELKARANDLKTAIAGAKQLGLPIGWGKDGMFDESTLKQFLKKDKLDREKIGCYWALWAVTTVLTGLLIGLGGPFWFDLVQRLTVVGQLAGALAKQQPASESADGSDTAAAGQDPKAAFKAVIDAQRVILGADKPVSGFFGPRGLRL